MRTSSQTSRSGARPAGRPSGQTRSQAGARTQTGQRADTRQTGQGARDSRQTGRQDQRDTRQTDRGDQRTDRQDQRTDRQDNRQEQRTDRQENRTDLREDRVENRSEMWDDYGGWEGEDVWWGYGESYESWDAWGAVAGFGVGMVIGTMLAEPPAEATTVVVTGTPYYVYEDTYFEEVYYEGEVQYQAVPPPPGVVVNSLPGGCSETMVADVTYQLCDNVYYLPVADGYEVVDPD